MNSLFLPLTALLAGTSLLLSAALPAPETYNPDLTKSDIYLPHLKRTPLSGWWKVKKVSSDRKNHPGDEGTRKQYHAADFDDSAWQRDLVPNDIHVPFLIKLPAVTDWNGMWNALPRTVREWGGVAWFRRAFTAPPMKKGERAILTFEEVAGDFTLYINGKKAGSGTPYYPPVDYKGGHIPHSFDITHLIRPGKNVIALRLFHNGHPVRWGWAGKAGILDLVYLDIRPPAYTANILVTTEKNLTEVHFDCILSGSEKSADTDGWTGEIFEWNSGKKAATLRFGKRRSEDGLSLVSGTAHMAKPKLWSCESPFLYGIRVRNARGAVTGVQRFGIRTFEVRNGNFVLNGKPVMLRGLTHANDAYPLWRHGWLYALRTNQNDIYRRYWQILGRDANVNHLRIHSCTLTRLQYDILDEYGILCADELDYPETAIKRPERADQIAVKGFDGACDKNGKLHPEFIRKIKERIHNSYSHPAICMYSFGNEIRQYDDPRVEKLLNNLYDLYHRIDRQQRPTTNSSGRFWKDGSNVKEMSEREKLDYIDTHDYTGSINNFPLAFCEPVARDFIRTVRKYYGKRMPPIINGETVYMADHYYPAIFDGIWKNADDPEPDWDKLLYMLTRWSKEHPEQSGLSYYWVRNWGSRQYKFNRISGRGIYTERILEAYRKCWPEYDGYETLSGAYFSMSNAWPFDRIELKKNEAFPYLARVNAPTIAIPDYIAPNRFTGEALSVRVSIVNNRETDPAGIRFEAEIERNGKTCTAAAQEIGALPSNGTKLITLQMTMPEEPGRYRLVWRLRSGKTLLNERDRELNLRNRSEVFRPIQTRKKVALYDAVSVFGGLKPYSTIRTLKAFGLPHTVLRKPEDLNRFDILILGGDSIDGRVQESAAAIRSFVENGGRLLVFEQSFIGRIPFLPELEYVLAGPGQFSELLKTRHPALKHLNQKDFFCWNQKDWSVYRHYITPLSRAALMIGGDTTQWGAGQFGMTAAHLKLGKGDVLFCQAEVTKNLKDDSGAAQFTRNLLETILNDSTRQQASAFKGHPLPKAAPLTGTKALPLSLRNTANRGFADPIAKDGKGGWTDQGPNNDLAPFPTGKRIFNGILFDIINPTANGGRSCLVVSDNPDLKFPAESKPIPVGAKLKRIVFLHSGAWMDETGKTHAGDYVITWASGRRIRVPVIAGQNIGDWWNAASKRFPDAECAWSAMNGSGVVGVYLFEWRNPHPDDPIRSVVLRGKNNAVIGLIALTGEVIP